jgi:hypothetical protein
VRRESFLASRRRDDRRIQDCRDLGHLDVHLRSAACRHANSGNATQREANAGDGDLVRTRREVHDPVRAVVAAVAEPAVVVPDIALTVAPDIGADVVLSVTRPVIVPVARRRWRALR